jgi:hypothetical protein
VNDKLHVEVLSKAPNKGLIHGKVQLLDLGMVIVSIMTVHGHC